VSVQKTGQARSQKHIRLLDWSAGAGISALTRSKRARFFALTIVWRVLIEEVHSRFVVDTHCHITTLNQPATEAGWEKVEREEWNGAAENSLHSTTVS